MFKRLIGWILMRMGPTVPIGGLHLPHDTIVVMRNQMLEQTNDVDRLLMLIAIREFIYDHYGIYLNHYQSSNLVREIIEYDVRSNA